MSGWWWLSFADGSLPEGQQFLGVAVVRGGDVIEAAREAHRLGCNPGGEVLGGEIREEVLPAAEWRERLLPEGQARELAAWMDERVRALGI